MRQPNHSPNPQAGSPRSPPPPPNYTQLPRHLNCKHILDDAITITTNDDARPKRTGASSSHAQHAAASQHLSAGLHDGLDVYGMFLELASAAAFEPPPAGVPLAIATPLINPPSQTPRHATPPHPTQRSYITASIDHRGERYRHKRVIDALNVQTRQGIPVRRSLARLQAEAQRVLDHKIRLTDDEAKILVAALVECQLRLVLEAELELAGGLYWNAIFWQARDASTSWWDGGWVNGGMARTYVYVIDFHCDHRRTKSRAPSRRGWRRGPSHGSWTRTRA